MGDTLAEALKQSTIGFDELERTYKPQLKIVKELIGVVPNCDLYLEIWPTGFETYNLLVPNLLNLPALLLGTASPKDLVGLAMYTSSREAECMYCSAHTCSFALRRGASEGAVTGQYNEAEAAVVAVAESMSRLPPDLTMAQVKELEAHLDPGDVEWVVLSVALMGFLNKFMDAMGIPLEPEAIADVQHLIEPTGWSTGKHAWATNGGHANGTPRSSSVVTDSLRTSARVLRQVPGAIRRESRWTKGVSGRIGQALTTLDDEIGYSFPTLASIQHKRVVKAITSVLRNNLDAERSVIGLPTKCMVALVFAKVVDNEMLIAEAVQLVDLLAPEFDPLTLAEVGEFAVASGEQAVVPVGLSAVDAAAITLARAGSPSPAGVNEITVSSVTANLTPAQIVEIVVWLSVLQMMHRLYVYYDARLGLT